MNWFKKDLQNIPDKLNLEDVYSDSPLIRDQIKLLSIHFDDSIDKLRDFEKSTRKYKEELKRFINAQNEFEKSITIVSSLCSKKLNSEKQILKILEIFSEIQKIQEMQTEQLQTVICQSIDNFLGENKLIKEIQKKAEKSKSIYDSFVTKQSKSKIKDLKLEDDLCVSKEIYKSMNMEYVLKLNEYIKKKDFFIETKVVDYFYVMRNYFHSVNTIFSSKEKEVNIISQEIKVSKNSLDEEVKEQRIKKNLLEKYKENASKHVTELSTKRKESLFVTNDVITEGYLFKKSSNVILNWEKCYCVIQGGVFSHYKNDRFKDSKKLNLLLCSVKPSPQDDRRFCFELISPQKVLLFQAETQEDQEKWISCIKNIIAEQLNKSMSLSETQKEGISMGRNERILQTLIKTDETNSKCVDCKSDNPKWASINLGILICIECSGVHRSLGVQISKVRSFELDDWENESVNVFKRLGNLKVNSILESNKEELLKETPTEWNRNTREIFIKAKYIDKKFVDKGDTNLTEEELNEKLIEAVKEKNLELSLKYIIFGANPALKDSKNKDMSLLHYAVLSEDSGLCEFIIQQNGINPNVVDSNLWSPIHYAAKIKNAMIISLLFKRRADLDVKTNEGYTAMDIATENQAADCLTLLRLAQLALSDKKKEFTQTLSFFSSLIKEMGDEEQF